MNLRKLARGKDCQVRLPEACCGDSSTTVLAHYRLAGYSGMGLKSPDWFGAWACHTCHDVVDRRSLGHLDLNYVKRAHLEGVLRTQAALLKAGVVRT